MPLEMETNGSQVILSSNITYSYHAAMALQRDGCLKRYICTVCFHSNIRSSRWLSRALPSYRRKKFQGRDISELDPHRVKMIWSAELLRKALPRLGLASTERAIWVNDHVYDWLARRWVEPCDVFHFVSPIGLYSAQKAKELGSIIICDVRTAYPDSVWQLVQEEYARLGIDYDSPNLGKRIEAEYAIADYWLVYSSYVKRTFVQAGFDAQRIFAVSPGVDLTRFGFSKDGLLSGNTSASSSNSVFRIIYTGQIIPGKGVHYLIEAFEALDLPQAELLLIGQVDGTMRSLVQRTIKRNPRVRATGSVPQTELSRYYRTGSVFVLPSSTDSWGLAVLEAMACGLPVIVTENVGAQEAIREGVDGFVVPIRSPAALQERLLYLYQRPELRREIGQAAHERAMEFTWARYGERLLEVYAEILRRDVPTLCSGV